MTRNSIPFVLVVDDEKPLRNFVERNLVARDFQVITASNGLEALAHFKTHHLDLVILDVMMPHMDGFETLRRIRLQSMIPVIMLSALGEENEIVQALNLGADDYLTKPFGVKELMARVHAVLRRSARTAESDEIKGKQLSRAGITVDMERRTVSVQNRSIEVTPTEFNLLVFFMENGQKVLTHKEILQHVWGPEYGDEPEYLRVYIGRLRQKLEADPSAPRYLQTVRGVGYLFSG